MKLYAFQPDCCGPLSFFVMAESEADAIKSVESYIITRKLTPYDYDRGLMSGGYTLIAVDVGEVIANDNA